MDKDEHIENRIEQSSRDEYIVKCVRYINTFMSNNNFDYIVVGSCGVQSYFDSFYRIPNDIDVVIRGKDEKQFIAKCRQEPGNLVSLLGRMKWDFPEFFAHVLVDEMKLIDVSYDTVFTAVSLTEEFVCTRNKMDMACAPEAPKIPVASIEMLFILTILRPLDSNALLDVRNLFSRYKFDINRYSLILESNPDVCRIVSSRLKELKMIAKKYKNMSLEIPHKLLLNVPGH